MGSCVSTVNNHEGGNTVKIGLNTPPVTTSKSEPPPTTAKTSARSNQSRLRTMALKDIKGFKRSDSIENFYDIETTIGRGSFGEVVKAKHLLTSQTRAIKVIEKAKVTEHEVLMQL